ncbi:MAG TPA: bifunctional riboflavin kinase/FAD synthetase [Chthoniobacterales bacterium]|jgi:riboflavin kinase/FMN adenylyltransferase
MRRLSQIAELTSLEGPLSLGIGVFDGVHLGHQAVIDCTLASARKAGGTPVIVTFDPHPARVLRPDNPPRLLTSTSHKLQLLGACGVENVLLVKFDAHFASQSPADFIRLLAAHSQKLHAICVGEDWAFGKNRSGNVDFLRKEGCELGFSVVAVPPVKLSGEIVSSTLVRRAVEAGELDRAAQFLGRPYTILGTVVSGAQLGRTLGFPTANLSAHNEQFPPNGVYAIEAQVGSTVQQGVANIGVRPTVENAAPGRLLEVHLFDFAEDLYGQDIEVSFAAALREEKKFANLDELRAQIALDAQSARHFFETRKT